MKNRQLPSFLIVGAAKCGTTSLHYYLKDHPNIFLPELKEPKFITSQFMKFPFCGPGDYEVERGLIKQYEGYIQIFSDAPANATVGEASADTLFFYENSIPIIKKFLGETKIVILLRNPIERAYSAYMHMIRDNRETLSFREALDSEEERMKQNWEFIWLYKQVGLYSEQVKAYLDNFEHVKIYLFEDLKDDPQALLKDLFLFLNVDTTFVPKNLQERYNVSGIPKNKFMHWFLHNKSIRSLFKPFIPEAKRREIMKKLKSNNLKKVSMFDEDRNYLKEYYQKDIKKLETLIDRDLSHWLK